ncbi:hypothetical protein [Deefgea piscis]|uniref:hypothetical protein n=1 Tax=Deefgea piscis TaxID=2739061 RepID=UPI001C80CF68|nr:hypothetical protein [Deefgea piscis]QZA80878.1 hypothetical protein K4H25_15510 [Deefgea piscis]
MLNTAVANLNSLPYFADVPDFYPTVTLPVIQRQLIDAGLIVEHTFQLGLIATWSSVPEVFSEQLFLDIATIGTTLGHPAMASLSDSQVIEWLNEQKKFGWLIRVEQLSQQHRRIDCREEGQWFYAERLDMALLAAVAWGTSPVHELETA